MAPGRFTVWVLERRLNRICMGSRLSLENGGHPIISKHSTHAQTLSSDIVSLLLISVLRKIPFIIQSHDCSHEDRGLLLSLLRWGGMLRSQPCTEFKRTKYMCMNPYTLNLTFYLKGLKHGITTVACSASHKMQIRWRFTSGKKWLWNQERDKWNRK